MKTRKIILTIYILTFVSCQKDTGTIEKSEFIQLMNQLADSWTSQNTDSAIECFVSDAVYMQPPDEQFYKGHEQLRPFFAALEKGTVMKFHNIWFDKEKQMGAAEFTFGNNGSNTSLVTATKCILKTNVCPLLQMAKRIQHVKNTARLDSKFYIVSKNKTPGRKRFTKKARLDSAKDWITKYDGKNFISGYSKWFGVDKICAIKELKTLGVIIPENLENQILESHKRRIEQRKTAKKDKIEVFDMTDSDSDDNLRFYCRIHFRRFSFWTNS